MPAVDATSPRWPRLPPGRGHYESYYLRAVHPAEPRGVWIRYTVSVAPGGTPLGQLWFTLFDRAAAGPRAVRVDAGEPRTGGADWIRLPNSAFGEGQAVGEARQSGISARWRLRWRADQPALQHLPRSWMYTARLPRTKLLSPAPAAVFDGELEVDGEALRVDGWPGMVGHNWGEQHAEEWVWLHGLGFAGAGADTWLDAAMGRVRLGPVVTPWVANGAVCLAGERIPLGGLGRRVGLTAGGNGCSVRLPGRGATVSATVSAPRAASVAWAYASPDGTPHQVLNCSLADLSMTVDRPGHRPVDLVSVGRAVYEWGRAPGA